MATSADLDIVEGTQRPAGATVDPEKDRSVEKTEPPHYADDAESLSGPNGEVYPTAEETETLRHVHGKVNWLIYTIGIIEMAERFAYYGTTAVCRSYLSIPPKTPVALVRPS